MQVEVYKNLHKNRYSIRHNGKVIGHAKYVYLEDVHFVVRQSGRERVLREGKKNVHAFMKGTLVAAQGTSLTDTPLPPFTVESNIKSGKRVDAGVCAWYNPYHMDSFTCLGAPIKYSPYVYANINSGVYVL